MSNDHIAKAHDRAHGRWREILLAVGLDPKCLNAKQGPCPMCGGTDRFTYDNRAGRGDYICRQCGAGDGIELIRKFRSWSHREVFQFIEEICGSNVVLLRPLPGPRLVAAMKDTTSEQFWAMSDMWRRARPTTVEDPVGQYLASRAIGLSPRVQNLRTLVNDGGREVIMVARLQDKDDRAVQLHRTWIKGLPMQQVEPGVHDRQRKMMPGRHPAGSAVQLYEGDKVMGIAEGIENALSAACMFAMPVWAALTAGRLAKFSPPVYVERLHVFADLDEDRTGQAAADELIDRMEARKLLTTAHLPPDVDVDWNDLLRAAMNGAGEFRAQ